MHDWLVMLFLGGDDDLYQFGQSLLDEATRVGSSKRVAVVAELDPTEPADESLRGPLFKDRREMKKIGLTQGDPQAIIDFVDDSKARYEARHRLLMYWDHGNGWQNVHVFDNVVEATDIRRSQQHGPHEVPDEAVEAAAPLFVNDLRAVLDEKRDIAIVAFDSCLMSMIEVAFQLRERAQFMVASQHLLPAARGWPYEALLRALTLNPRMEPEELVRTMVDTFAGSYNGENDAVTLSGLRLSAEVDRAVAAIDSFSLALLDAIHSSDHGDESVRGEIVYARLHTQSFGNPDYIDIVSFCEEIQKRLPNEAKLNRAAELVKVAIARLVVRHTRSGSPSIGHANGVSIYFPHVVPQSDEVRSIAESYAKLDFANTLYCRWSTFLKVLIEGASVHDAQQMATVSKIRTVRFRGICCFVDPTNGESFKKRVILPNGKGHQHDDQEEHLPIIEFFADDLKTPPDGMPLFDYTRPGDGGQYQRIQLDEPVLIELLGSLGTLPQGAITRGLNLEESLIHLNELVEEDIQLKRTLLGPAIKVDPRLAVAVVDLPKGVLMAGPPEPVITKFPNSPKFTERRAARWLEHITQVDGEFGLKLTPLGKPRPVAREIWFKSSTRMITIANEPLRFIVGHFVTNPPKPAAKTGPQGGAVPMKPPANPVRPTGHFDMYWDLISDPPSRPVPEPSLGTGPGCAPANKP